MIRRTGSPRIPGQTEAAVRLRALLHTYGADRPFLPFYQGEDGAVCALLDGTAVWLPGAGGEFEEMALFLTMQPQVHTVRTSGDAARALSKSWGVPAHVGAVMTPARRFCPPEGGGKPGGWQRMDGARGADVAENAGGAGEPGAARGPEGLGDAGGAGKGDTAGKPGISGEMGGASLSPEMPDSVLVSPAPREVYPLLCACFGDTLPPFESWYADVSHRLRHGHCRLVGVRAGETLAACAMTTAECPPDLRAGRPSRAPEGVAAEWPEGAAAEWLEGAASEWPEGPAAELLEGAAAEWLKGPAGSANAALPGAPESPAAAGSPAGYAEGTKYNRQGDTLYNGGAALIGAVATLPAYRGRGFASRCVSALAAALQAENRRVLLSPKNSPAEALYTRLGFAVCGEWGEIHRDGAR